MLSKRHGTVFLALAGLTLAACQASPGVMHVAGNVVTLVAQPTATATFVSFANGSASGGAVAGPTRTAVPFERAPASPTATFLAFGRDAASAAIPAAIPVSRTPLPTLAQPTLPGSITLVPPSTPTSPATASPTATLPPPPLVIIMPAFQDHFLMARPFDPEYTNWVSRNYPYGSTGGGNYRPHHGVDIMNPSGTPVRAAAEGTVIFAGTDAEIMLGPQANFYGNVIIIEHDFATATGLPVYSLYGHLSQISVEAGQRVGLYHQIGLVGATGVAQGAHLHFEVRAGDPFDYYATRNPDLWIQNFNGFGVMAGQVRDAAGDFIHDLLIDVSAPGVRRNLSTYASPDIRSDDQLNENFAIGDLPAGEYTVVIRYDERTYRETVIVYPNRVNWVEITLP